MDNLYFIIRWSCTIYLIDIIKETCWIKTTLIIIIIIYKIIIYKTK